MTTSTETSVFRTRPARGWLRVAAIVLATSATLALAPAASAQSSVAKTTAATLFQEGRALMERGDYAAACPKLAESQRLDPGGGTLLNLALCRKGEGRTATAWVLFREAAAVAAREGKSDREAAARAEIAELEPKLSRMVVTVPEAARVPGLVVTVDGVILEPAAWGVATPVDPRPLAVRAAADGYVAWETKVDASAPASRSEVTIQPLERAPAGSVPPPPKPPGPGAAPPPPARDDSTGDGQRVVGLVIGGVGAAGVIVGAITGALALSAQSSADEACPDTDCGIASAVSDNESAHSFATVSNIGFIAGGTLLAAGATIYLLAPSSDGTSATTLRAFANGTARGPALGVVGTFD